MHIKNTEINQRPVVYVAGPMTAPTHYGWEKNIRKAEDRVLELYHLGYSPHSPQMQSRYFRDDIPFEAAMEADFSIIAKCEAVLFLPGWSRSRGSKLELDFCIDQGIPAFFSLEELNEWKQEWNQQ